MILGSLLAVLEDCGPMPRLNLSSLDEIESMKLAVAGMTAIGFGHAAPFTHGKLYGPFPVGESQTEIAFAFPFSVSGALSADNRVQYHGRECNLFLLTASASRDEILKNFGKIEILIRQKTQELLEESHLTELWLKSLITELNAVFSIIQSPTKGNEATGLQDLKLLAIKETESPVLVLLNDIGVGNLDNPILFDSFEPNIATFEQEQQLSVVADKFHAALSACLTAKSKAPAHNYAITLEKIGHYFFWQGIRQNSMQYLDHARKYYDLALTITNSPLLMLTIGSIDNKLGRDSSSLIKEGLGKYDKRLRLSRKILLSKSLRND